MKNHRKIVGATVACAAVLVTSACGSSSKSTTKASSSNTAATSGKATGTPIKVSLLDDVSGTLAVSFKPAAAGFQTYIDMINDSGGVNGHPIQVDLLDDQSSPDVGLANAQKAIAGSPVAVMHLGSSATAARVAPVVAGAGIPFVTGSAADSAVYPVQKNVFQVGMTAKQQGALIGEFLKTKLGSSIQGASIDIAAGNSPYIDAVIAAATASLQSAGAKIGRTDRYAFGLPSFTAQAGNIAQDKPAAVLNLATANDAVTVATALGQAGYKGPQVGFNGSAAKVVFTKINNPNYFAPTEATFPEDDSQLLAVADKYGRKADVAASLFSQQGWTEAAVLVEGLKQCGNGCDSTKLSAGIEKVHDFTVPMNVSYGTVTFGSSDHVSADKAKFHAIDASGGVADLDAISLVNS